MHEFLVPRYVDKAEHIAVGLVRCRTVRYRHVGETEFDADAPRFLFLEAIRVDTCQLRHQQRLTMIDMTRSSNDHAAPLRQAMGMQPKRDWRKGVGVEPTRDVRRPSSVLKTVRPTGERVLSINSSVRMPKVFVASRYLVGPLALNSAER